jgi:hypothetical protein
VSLKPPASMPKSDREFQHWCRQSHDMGVLSGEGTPENAVTARIGTLYRRLDGGAGTSLYVKESGDNTDTGWVAK